MGPSSIEVEADGRVDVEVRDLVLTRTGANPLTTVWASLLCGGPVVDTVRPVADDADGEARIRDRCTVPERCLAPAVLLSPATRVTTCIAATGQAG